MTRDTRPNILLVLMDSSQAGAHSCYGHPVCRTPSLDRLPREGARFAQAYTAAPICHPARAAIDTGCFPHRSGMLTNSALGGGHPFQVFPEVPSLAQCLSGDGYRSGYAGQGHLALRGFHDDRSIPTHRYMKELGARGLAERPTPETARRWCGRLPHSLEDSRDGCFATAALDLLHEYASNEAPWFLQCDFDGPHPPFYVCEPFAALYSPAEVPIPASLRDPLDAVPPAHANARRAQGVLAWDEAEWRAHIAYYLGYVSMLDALLGRLLDTLQELGLAENTAVFVTSDHAEMVGGHGIFTKYAGLFEEALHVPLVARLPSRWPAGRVPDGFVSGVDLMPTFAELAGVPAPACHGRSLLPALCGRDPSPRDDILCQYHGDGVGFYTLRSVRTADWKYVHAPFATDEVYDLRADPGETRNLIAEPAAADARDAMRRRLLRWMEDVGDPLARASSRLWV